MNWMQFLLDVVITGALVYVIQTVFDERASRRLEEFKTNLRSAAFEHETRFARLHERQAEVIAELYKRLVRLQSNLRSFAHTIDSEVLNYTKREQDKATGESLDAFRDYFREHRIYLPESLGERIEEFWRLSMLAYAELAWADLSQDLASDDESYSEQYIQELANASQVLADKISPVRDDIAQEFRKLIGS